MSFCCGYSDEVLVKNASVNFARVLQSPGFANVFSCLQNIKDLRILVPGGHAVPGLLGLLRYILETCNEIKSVDVTSVDLSCDFSTIFRMFYGLYMSSPSAELPAIESMQHVENGMKFNARKNVDARKSVQVNVRGISQEFSRFIGDNIVWPSEKYPEGKYHIVWLENLAFQTNVLLLSRGMRRFRWFAAPRLWSLLPRLGGVVLSTFHLSIERFNAEPNVTCNLLVDRECSGSLPDAPLFHGYHTTAYRASRPIYENSSILQTLNIIGDLVSVFIMTATIMQVFATPVWTGSLALDLAIMFLQGAIMLLHTLGLMRPDAVGMVLGGVSYYVCKALPAIVDVALTDHQDVSLDYTLIARVFGGAKMLTLATVMLMRRMGYFRDNVSLAVFGLLVYRFLRTVFRLSSAAMDSGNALPSFVDVPSGSIYSGTEGVVEVDQDEFVPASFP